MKNRKSHVPPPPFVKVAAPRPEPTVKVIHTIRESLPVETTAQLATLTAEEANDMLAAYERKCFMLHHELARTVAMRDALNTIVNTKLEAPHWVRHASIANLHGGGARLLPCAKCGKQTEWSFGGNPQCTFKGLVPHTAAHAVCMKETGFKRNVTIHERDLANILSIYGKEKGGKKK